MASSQADLARLDAVLKDRELVDSLQSAINKSTAFAEKVTQQLTLSGRKGIFPVSFGVNEGIYARADKGTFGDSQVDQPSLASVTAKFIYAIFEISGPTMSATRDSEGAFEDALALQLEQTVDGVKLDMARMILGKGDGVIAIVNTRTDADTYVIKNPFNLSYKSNRPVRNLLRKNMPIDILDNSSPSTKRVNNSAISAISHTASLTTIDFAPVESTSGDADDLVTRAGNYNLEIQGFFGAHQTSGNYLGISRTGQPGWQGVVTDAAGGGAAAVALDPDMLRDQNDLIMEETGYAPDVLVTNYKQRRNIYNLYAPQIRYAPMVLPAGLRESTLAFDDTPVLVERFFPPEHIGFANTKFWYHAIDKDVEWIQGQNGTVLHFNLTSDTFRAIMRSYRDFINMYPATGGYLWGLEE